MNVYNLDILRNIDDGSIERYFVSTQVDKYAKLSYLDILRNIDDGSNERYLVSTQVDKYVKFKYL